MGRHYLIEQCIYTFNERQKRLAFEIYVTDRLKGINDSLASFYGGATTKIRFIEALEGMKKPEKPEKTAEEVISSISDKLERLSNEPI